MEHLEIKVLVPKEIYELGQGLVVLVKAMKEAQGDLSKLAGVLPALLPAVDGVTKLGEELAADKGAFVKALALAGADIADLFGKSA